MAALDDLVSRVGDPQLRKDLERAVAQLKSEKKFGLVFEQHLPETLALPGLPLKVGQRAVRRDDPEGKTVYRIDALPEGEDATVAPEAGGEAQSVPKAMLMAVTRFGEPIYPVLTPLGTVERGPKDRPHHAVINGENYHALQLLRYLYPQQVDCVYLDPPYNSGAKDWKYNNRFVDANDQWRHSKWLSMMEHRLRLVKALLKPDGVLIVTIDEHEVQHLGPLLTQIFPECVRQMVTIVINPKGVTQERFSRVDEYAFFCFRGGSTVSGKGDDLLTPGADSEELASNEGVQRPRWKGLLRSGDEAQRKDRKPMFYPLLIDLARGAVVGVGEPLLSPDDHPKLVEPDVAARREGIVEVWPIRSDKSEGRWGVGCATLRDLISKGYVKLGEYDKKRRTWGITYLTELFQEQIQSGVLEIIEFDQEKNVVDVAFTDSAQRRLKTVWHRSRHDAGVGGTDLLKSLIGERVFPFPKSVYAVEDCLKAVLMNRKDALVVDVFAGSGTTLHALCLLNASDRGRRKGVIVTNNAVSEGDAQRLAEEGFLAGDKEYEAFGIFEQATRPRVEAMVTGLRSDHTPVKGQHIGGRLYAKGFDENVAFLKLDYLDPDRIEVGRQLRLILPALWLAAGGVGEVGTVDDGASWVMPKGSTFAVLLDESRVGEFMRALAGREDVTHVWFVTNSEEHFAEMRAGLKGRRKAGMLVRDYLRNFRIDDGMGSAS